MKTLSQYINEFLINKKLDKLHTNGTEILYTPNTKEELQDIIEELLNKGETNLNCIDVSDITDMSYLFDAIKDI